MKTRLLTFIDALRDAGLPITVAETLDAMHAVGVIGVERTAFRESLAATLIKDQADRPDFDAVFDRFFAVPGRRRGKGQQPQLSEAGEAGRAGRSESRSRRDQPPERTSPEPSRRNRLERHRQLRDHERESSDSGRESVRSRALAVTPFQVLSQRHIEACDVLLAQLAKRLRAHISRRKQAGRRGRLDIRRTLRRSVSAGGVPIEPVFREPRPGRPDLVALCDFSHSVLTASSFLLALLTPARDLFRHARLFAFVDRPVEVSVELGHLVPHDRLDLYARSDFGRVLVEFSGRYESTLTRNTILLILGDARNNRRPPRADVLGRLRRHARYVVWLNPDSLARWNTGDSVIRAYEPYCDTVIAASNLRELYLALRRTF